ncbi:MAG: S1C family serine protease [Verrucomicrobiales bacterium]|jgi:S1-C subfamily serine protease|nr:S1C family serine protease [Verrucomicrobiales bacterium]
MPRLISLLLFILLTVAAIAWLTGIESPFAGARTHSVLAQKGDTPPATEYKPAAPPSLLLGSNVDAGKSTANKTPVIAAAAVPSLVSVEVSPGAEWPDEPAVRKLLTRLAAEGLTTGGRGAGFFIDRQGTILTTFSALLGGFAWTARTADGQEYEAALVGADAVADLALLRVTKPDATPVRWAAVPPGFAEHLLMLGFGAQDGPRVTSVMTGSGLLETTLPEEALTLKYYLVDGAEQRAGWLLLTMDGAAAGIVARLALAGEGTAKTAVVICPESLAPVIELLGNSPVPHRVYPGLVTREITPALARQLGLPPDRGLLVTKLSADSPLKLAGLQTGDVVTELGGVLVNSKAQFFQSLSVMAIGAKVPLTVQRDGRLLTLQVILREYKNIAQDWLDLVAKHQKSQPPLMSDKTMTDK